MKRKFKSGDRITVTTSFWRYDGIDIGHTGTVERLMHDDQYAVVMDDFTEGHDCEGCVENEYYSGWELGSTEMELLDKPIEFKVVRR